MEFSTLPSGRLIPRLGMGTWRMGEYGSSHQAEISALCHGIDQGLTLIDTAEMYGEGGAEKVIAEAISSCRSEVFLVSKVYPHNASRKGTIAACDRSLARLKTDYLDLYLLHWRGGIPLAETLEALKALKTSGKILEFGVSNFDREDMNEAIALPYGNEIAVNQVLYNLTRRGIEWDLLPWCEQYQIPVMAYSPLEQGRMLGHPALKAIAPKYHATPAQVAIAWLLHQENVIVIPKSSRINRINENKAALEIKLSVEDLNALDNAFPAPNHATPLQML